MSSILQGKRFKADEVFVAVGTDRSIRGEVDGASKGDIDAAVKSLQASLLLSIADIDGDLRGTEILERGSRTAILPRNDSRLATRVGGGSDWGSHEDGGKGRRGNGEGNKDLGEHSDGS